MDVALIRKEFLPKAVAEDILGEDKRDITEQLASLDLYDLRYNCPTNEAIVLFGKNPERYIHGAYIQYVRFKGKNRAGDILNEHKFSGNLCKVLPKIDAFCRDKYIAKASHSRKCTSGRNSFQVPILGYSRVINECYYDPALIKDSFIALTSRIFLN